MATVHKTRDEPLTVRSTDSRIGSGYDVGLGVVATFAVVGAGAMLAGVLTGSIPIMATAAVLMCASAGATYLFDRERNR